MCLTAVWPVEGGLAKRGLVLRALGRHCEQIVARRVVSSPSSSLSLGEWRLLAVLRYFSASGLSFA